MRLFIAEKPSLGRAIADRLGHQVKGDGCITCGRDVITWCFGHMLESYEPEDYDPALKHWSRSSLPIIPAQWKLKVKPDAAKQMRVIGELLKKADSVVNAGDPDREGQLLVDEVLEHFGYSGPVARIWLSSLDERSVDKALANLGYNQKYAPLRDAARARSQADWLVGLNATRAMSILGREAGQQGVLSLGRVQTPTLNLVVTRDREIAAFRPIDFYTIQANLEHASGPFKALYVPSDDQPGLDSQGRLVNTTAAMGIVEAIKSAHGAIAAVSKEKKQKAPPLPHCLSSLQKAASARFGMSAQQVLDTAQSLYEEKLTTYPRSDCRYLPVEQFADAGRILSILADEAPIVQGLGQIAAGADAKLKSAAWNTGKVTAHHAIIPTGETPCSISEAELAIYNMIATAYCLQFYPPLVYESQKIRVDLDGKVFEARGRLVLDPG